MCTTKKYLYVCECPASSEFRNDLCETPGLGRCRLVENFVFLREPCHHCIETRDELLEVPVNGADSSDDSCDDVDDEDVWQMPTRCFIDCGFKTLDPFKADRDKKSISWRPMEEDIAPEVLPPIRPTTEPPTEPHSWRHTITHAPSSVLSWLRSMYREITLAEDVEAQTAHGTGKPRLEGQGDCCFHRTRLYDRHPRSPAKEGMRDHYGKIRDDHCTSMV
jgi:hypothetical protein